MLGLVGGLRFRTYLKIKEWVVGATKEIPLTHLQDPSHSERGVVRAWGGVAGLSTWLKVWFSKAYYHCHYLRFFVADFCS